MPQRSDVSETHQVKEQTGVSSDEGDRAQQASHVPALRETSHGQETQTVITYGEEEGATIRVSSLNKLVKTERLIVFGSQIVPEHQVIPFVKEMSGVQLRSDGLRWIGVGGLATTLFGGGMGALIGIEALAFALPLIIVGATLAGTSLIMSGGRSPTMEEFSDLFSRVKELGPDSEKNQPGNDRPKDDQVPPT